MIVEKRGANARELWPEMSAASFLNTVASLACNVLKITSRTSLTLFLSSSFFSSLSLSAYREIIVVYLRYPFSDLSWFLNCLDEVAVDAPKWPRGIPERVASWLLRWRCLTMSWLRGKTGLGIKQRKNRERLRKERGSTYIIQIPCRSVSGNVILVRMRVSTPLSEQHLICFIVLSFSLAFRTAECPSIGWNSSSLSSRQKCIVNPLPVGSMPLCADWWYIEKDRQLINSSCLYIRKSYVSRKIAREWNINLFI